MKTQNQTNRRSEFHSVTKKGGPFLAPPFFIQERRNLLLFRRKVRGIRKTDPPYMFFPSHRESDNGEPTFWFPATSAVCLSGASMFWMPLLLTSSLVPFRKEEAQTQEPRQKALRDQKHAKEWQEYARTWLETRRRQKVAGTRQKAAGDQKHAKK